MQVAGHEMPGHVSEVPTHVSEIPACVGDDCVFRPRIQPGQWLVVDRNENVF